MKAISVSLLCLYCLFFMQSVQAGSFINSGRMQLRNVNISVNWTFDNNGELIGTDTANIECETITGKGVIRSPQISIKTKIFAYTGTIDCSEKCTITVSTPFKDTMFKRKGKGEFTVIIDESLEKKPVPSAAIDYTLSDEVE